MRRMMLVMVMLAGLYIASPDGLRPLGPLHAVWDQATEAAVRQLVTTAAAWHARPETRDAASAALRQVRAHCSDEERAIIDRYLELEGVDLHLR